MRHPIPLQRIRRSDPKTKLQWLIGLSSVTVLVIVIAWIFYMRAFVFTAADSTAREDVHIGFWPVFKNGLTITGSSIGHAFDNLLSGMPSIGRRTTIIENRH